MNAIIEEEPLSLAQHAKATFQADPPPREVKPPEPKPKSEVPSKEPVVPANPKEKVDGSVAPTPVPAPKSEEDTVFGTSAKETPPPKGAEPSDAEFEAKLKEDTKGMPDRSADKFRELRLSEKTAREDARQAREELKAVAEARQQEKGVIGEDTGKLEAAQAEITALKAQLEEAETTLSVTQVERSKKFRSQVTEPMGEVTKQVEEIAARYDVSPKDILRALDADPKERTDQLETLVGEFKEADRIEIYQAARDMDRLKKAGEQFRTKAKEDYSALEAEERQAEERTAGEIAQTRGAAAKRTWDEAAKTWEFLRPVEGAPDWTAALARDLSRAQNYQPGRDAAEDGAVAARAAQHPFIIRALEKSREQTAKLAEENKKLLARIETDNALDPDLGGNRDDDAPKGGDGDEGLSLGERAKAHVAGSRR